MLRWIQNYVTIMLLKEHKYFIKNNPNFFEKVLHTYKIINNFVD